MDLSTTYMGMKLKNPLVASASSLSKEIDNIRAMEDSGLSAVVLYSLFEEQLVQEEHALDHFLVRGTESYAESLSYFPDMEKYNLGPDEYLNHLRKAKEAVDIPVIASLNGVSAGGWMDYARRIQEAGADALELNIYYVATDMELTSAEVEAMYVEDVKRIKATVSIPVAVKISPFFSALANVARRLDEAGADALVLFNRFYQPDIDLEKLEVFPNLILSTEHEMRLPLRWIAVLHGRVKASLAATTGIYTERDVLKMLMAGADVTMLCSALYRNGIQHPRSTRALLDRLRAWMEEHEYISVEQMKGSMSQKNVAEPAAFERANYMKTLQSFDPDKL
ncbi:MAG: dihydroorotate dehydrogenase-like protein [Chlorobi bacterium]|nr:dihydroorotate dehydrogenase-like protein [Chlorobiota bacterium]